jgi:hypothetical protein
MAAKRAYIRPGNSSVRVAAPDGKEHYECIVFHSSIRINLLTHFHEDVNGHLGLRKLSVLSFQEKRS